MKGLDHAAKPVREHGQRRKDCPAGRDLQLVLAPVEFEGDEKDGDRKRGEGDVKRPVRPGMIENQIGQNGDDERIRHHQRGQRKRPFPDREQLKDKTHAIADPEAQPVKQRVPFERKGKPAVDQIKHEYDGRDQKSITERIRISDLAIVNFTQNILIAHT